MLRLRVLSAAVALPLLAAALWWGGLAFALLVAVAVAVATFELTSLFQAAGTPLSLPLLTLLALAPVADAAAAVGRLAPQGAIAAPALTLGTMAALLLALRAHPHPWPVEAWALTVALPVYVGWLAAHAVLLRGADQAGMMWMALTLAGVFAGDTAAYFVGRRWGRRRLAPAISPGKSVEGALAGVAAATVLCLFLAWRLGLPVWRASGLGLVVATAGVVGDLAESYLKRQTRAKDASGLFPGHGGLLDRLDSLLFGTAAAYYYLEWTAPGGP